MSLLNSEERYWTVSLKPQLSYLFYPEIWKNTHKHTSEREKKVRDTDTDQLRGDTQNNNISKATIHLQWWRGEENEGVSTPSFCLWMTFSGFVDLWRFSLSYVPVWLLCPFLNKVEKLWQINRTTFQQIQWIQRAVFCPSRSSHMASASGLWLWILPLYLDYFVVHWLQWTI